MKAVVRVNGEVKTKVMSVIRAARRAVKISKMKKYRRADVRMDVVGL